MANIVLDRMIDQRFLLARLGVVPKTYGVWMEDREGNLIPFKRPKNPRQEIAEVLRRMGLSWRGIRARVTTSPISTLEDIPQDGYKMRTKMGRVYIVNPESIGAMQTWADRRNARRQTAMVTAEERERALIGLTGSHTGEGSPQDAGRGSGGILRTARR